MKPQYLCLFLLIFTLSLQAQEYNWVQQMGSVDFDFSKDIQFDMDGNVYSIGLYRGEDFTIGNDTLPFIDRVDSYLAKFDSNGELLWTIPFYGIGIDRADGIQIDEEGDVYMLSTIEQSLQIGDQDSIYVPLSRGVDILLMKFTSEGELLWHYTFGGPSFDLGYHMLLRENDILLAGSFIDTIYFGIDTLVSVNKSQDMIIASVDLNGNPLWARQYGEEGEDRLYQVEQHQNGDLVVCGYTEGVWKFGQTDIFDTLIGHDLFLGRLDADGNALWAVHGQSLERIILAGLGLTTDNENNTYLSTNYRGSLTFGPMTIQGNLTYHLLLARIDPNGNIDWVQTSKGSNKEVFTGIYVLEIKNDRLIAMGEIGGGMQAFGTDFDTSFQQNLILAVLNRDGEPESIFNDGGSGWIQGWGMDINESLQMAFAAYGSGSIQLGEQNFVTRNEDIFVGTLDLTVVLTSSSHSSFLPTIKIYPNPTTSEIQIETGGEHIKSVRLLTQSGQMIGQFSGISPISIHNLPPGMYYVQCIGEDFQVLRKIVKVQ